MGIPGFASRMQAHGSTQVIGRKGEQCHSQAIIDGPSLAHTLARLVQDRHAHDAGIAPNVSYSEIGEAAVAWLENQESFGFKMCVVLKCLPGPC